MSKKYAVYGTLRKGYGNHRRLENKKGVKYIETKEIEGFDMYAVASFPGIIRGNGKIIAEIYEIDNPEVEESLDFLEGYTEGDESSLYVKEKTKEGELIYIWNREIRPGVKRIINGDFKKPKYEI